MLLELQQVSKVFGQRPILKDINVQVLSGQINLLMGSNGAGKSTLLNIMAGISKISFGKISLYIEEHETAYLGHATFIYPALSARENLTFWANIYGLGLGKKLNVSINSVLERMELLPFAEEKAGVFSRGMSQRLNLARILLLKPKLWLLDEPSTGLDVHSAKLLRQEVLEAKKHGAGIVWISHDLQNDAILADNIWQIENTRLSTFAKEAEVYTC